MREQYDDHCWITMDDEGWAIRAIKGSRWYLWRGYGPDIEEGVLDVSRCDWETYCNACAALLAEQA